MKFGIAIVAWITLGAIVEIDYAFVRAQQHTKLRLAEQKQAEQRKLHIAEDNLHQAETFIRMCLDQGLKYAYLGDLVLECQAKETKHKLKT